MTPGADTEIGSALRGVTPPLVTPFQDGAVDHDALGNVVEHTVSGGVAGLFANGTTGEFASLTAGEREAVVETTVAHAGDIPVLAGVGDTALPDVVDHVERAAGAGATAVVLTPPYYHAASEPAGNVSFLERIADDASLPVLLYDIPSHTGNELAVESVLALADHPNVVGMKDSSGDFTRFCTLLRETPDDFTLLQGFDAQLLPSIRLGADGGINGLANVVPELLVELAGTSDTARDGSVGDRRLEIHERIGPLFETCLDLGFPSAVKAALVERNVLDHAEVRPPLTPVDPGDVADVLDRAVT